MTARERVKDRAIGIVGMARSGVAAALLASDFGGKPFVSDAASREKLSRQVATLEAAGIDYETGGHTARLLESDYIVLSPGVSLNIDILQKAAARGIPLFSEIEFASWICRGTVIAVTGSNGKTTTTTLIGEMLKAAGRRAFVCGNVGLPFSEVAAEVPPDGFAVVEVSTFQLETTEDFHPHVALILNLSPDHLDRHGTFEVYKSLKYRICENQSAEDWLILNEQDRVLSSDNIETEAPKLWFSAETSPRATTTVDREQVILRLDGEVHEVIDSSEIAIPGPHNLQNALAAVAAVSRVDRNIGAMRQALKSFAGVEHRMERVASVAGIHFINDSKATNVDSVCYALRSVDTPVYLIAGGREKGAPYSPIVEHGKGKIKGIVAIGEAKEKIFAELGREFPVTTAESLEEAVAACFEMAHPGETVLLSPACASFDMFENYEHRGRAFKKSVAALKNGKSSGEKVQS